jgi:hypothetical protein
VPSQLSPQERHASRLDVGHEAVQVWNLARHELTHVGSLCGCPLAHSLRTSALVLGLCASHCELFLAKQATSGPSPCAEQAFWHSEAASFEERAGSVTPALTSRSTQVENGSPETSIAHAVSMASQF